MFEGCSEQMTFSCRRNLLILLKSIFEDLLLQELKHKTMSLIEADWDQIQIKFLQRHHYFTQTSLYLRKGLKKKHLQFLINKYS